MDTVESYAKLRMNLFYTLVGKESHTVLITSGISGEGKSTIAANLAISCAMSDRRVILVDADMRRACQGDVFHYENTVPGLSDVLVGNAAWQDVILRSKYAIRSLAGKDEQWYGLDTAILIHETVPLFISPRRMDGVELTRIRTGEPEK
jgi:Mrp family chromosome partitioning ATPase